MNAENKQVKIVHKRGRHKAYSLRIEISEGHEFEVYCANTFPDAERAQGFFNRVCREKNGKLIAILSGHLREIAELTAIIANTSESQSDHNFATKAEMKRLAQEVVDLSLDATETIIRFFRGGEGFDGGQDK